MEPTPEQIALALTWMAESGSGYKKAAQKYAGTTDPAALKRFVAVLRERRRANPPPRKPSRTRAREEPPEEDDDTPPIVIGLRKDLAVVQEAIDALVGEGMGGRQAMALASLVKRSQELRVAIDGYMANVPDVPQSDEEMLLALGAAMKDWDDRALELAFDEYTMRHRCRITVHSDGGRSAERVEGGWSHREAS